MLFEFNKKNVYYGILVVYVLVQVIGIYTGWQYVQLVNAGLAQPIFANPSDPFNAIQLMFYILVMTAFLLILIRLKKQLIYVLEALAIFFTSDIVFELAIPFGVGPIPVGAILAFALTAWKVFRPTVISQNIALIFSVAGAGAVIGASFGMTPVILFMLLLSAYDFLSVFYTKHMVYMAKALTERPTAFTAAFPVKDTEKRGKITKQFSHVFQLGGGDLVIPLVFSVSVLTHYGFVSMIFSSLGAMAALMLLFFYAIKRNVPLPALPPIAAGAFIGFAISLLI